VTKLCDTFVTHDGHVTSCVLLGCPYHVVSSPQRSPARLSLSGTERLSSNHCDVSISDTDRSSPAVTNT
jgi:hypothetical protein